MLLCCRRNHAGPNDPLANILLARFVILCENQTSSLNCLIIFTVMFIFLTPLVVSWCARIPQILSRSQADAVYDPGRHIFNYSMFLSFSTSYFLSSSSLSSSLSVSISLVTNYVWFLTGERVSAWRGSWS